jgi:anti-sigma regulatory factor (Ser/Thr protein kinase)/biotin operon repressor
MSPASIDNKSACHLQFVLMGTVRARGEEIRQFILKNVQGNSSNISKLAADKFGITRQAVNQHMKKLADEGALKVKGNTRGRIYELAEIFEWVRVYQLTPELEEDIVWRDDVQQALGKLSENVRDIWAYGFTEMFNNARDHSSGTSVLVSIKKTAVTTEMLISDNGIGIFRKIQKAMNLLDERHAILELSKGKLTTDPTKHSGEGIFFTSRVFDAFDILSGGVLFSHEFGKEEDWLFERDNPGSGTAVFLKLANHTARTTKKVFDQFSSESDDYGFTKTVVPVKLAQYGNDKLISRSQAKRVMARVELFKRVLLDFRNVPTIGQAFADEVFRVFQFAHPEVELVAVNTNSEVKRMITRAVSNTGSPELTVPFEEPPKNPSES